MHKLSIKVPNNEIIINPKDIAAEWEKYSEAVQKVPKNLDIPMIINGKKVYSTKKVKNLNPSNGEAIGTYQQADSSHAQQAIEAALNAKMSWAALSPSARIQKFRDLEVILVKWKYELCATSSVECGYNSFETYVEWAELLDFVRFNNYYYAELLMEQMGDGWGETNQMQLRPLKGFTCAVSPFNFPQAIGYNLPLSMALTGNTVVWKPSDDSVLSGYLLMLALDEAGFPPGVINMISGDGKPCLPTVLTHPELTAVNFTGSFATAKAFGNYLYSSEYSRKNFPRYVAETGGKDFLVADKEIDILDTARCIVQGAFGRSGQKCSANSVGIIDEHIWPELKEILIKETNALNICNAVEKKCDVGPVINERQYDKIASFIERAKNDKNCKVIVGGNCDKKNGFYVSPTIIEVNADKHELLSEEIFGPVIAIKTYKKFEEIVPIIELHNYRLTGSVISRNETFLEKAIPILSQYAGNFYVNRKTTGAIVNMQPFGGDGASGTNGKAGGKWYLLNFVSQGLITRRHVRSTTPTAMEKIVQF
ncbi:aldehyde dehydrogenase family protein [Fluviispira sanaruensis]|uniref:L-glutamate gamma-semialdehyde dehydrogenase n=1 Tax=Fluviispira sanaruensis TaxID=2493639 RepID=A0A4P2VM00_FLUSA|nr:aldehyde dehydrogenase family protein [Fluviispira sanaruensis]BBH54403.1 1-pyrroline-5-carboxylate dehydrogenase [Fluviispira sanaruensis]